MARQPTNRDALLAAAVQCLRERGYARTSVRDLVTASGTNLGAVGYHFGSKDALLIEAITHNVREWIDALGELVRRQVTSGGGVQAVLDELITTTREHEQLVIAFFDALAQAGHLTDLRQQLAGCYEQFRRDVADAFRPLIDEMATTVNQRAMASLLLAVSDGLIMQCLLDSTAIPTSAQLADALGALSQSPQLDL